MNSILFICPVFNGYEKIIKKTLEHSGLYDKVFFVQDCPLPSISIWASIKNISRVLQVQLLAMYNDKIERLVRNNKINKIFIIKGEYLSSQTLSKIRYNSGAEIVIYQWDSLRNNPNALNLRPYADRFYTFDPIDSTREGLLYLPLFYSWEEAGFVKKNKRLKYDIFYVGGYMKSRIPYIHKVRDICKSNNLSYFFWSFERFGSFVKNFKQFYSDFNDINFRHLSYKKYFDYLCMSKCVLDIPSPMQTGLTMRTMETLSLGKKLVTTNQSIKKELFFNSNVLVIDNIEDITEEEFIHFLRKPYAENKGLLTLTNWLIAMKVL